LPETCREAKINIRRSSVHLVGLIWKRLYRNARSTKQKNKTQKVGFGGDVYLINKR